MFHRGTGNIKYEGKITGEFWLHPLARFSNIICI